MPKSPTPRGPSVPSTPTSRTASGLGRARILGIGLGVVGVVVTAVGLFLISRGDITAAPLLLVVAYLVLFPLALTRE